MSCWCEDRARHLAQVLFGNGLQRPLERGGIDPQLLTPAQ